MRIFDEAKFKYHSPFFLYSYNILRRCLDLYVVYIYIYFHMRQQNKTVNAYGIGLADANFISHGCFFSFLEKRLNEIRVQPNQCINQSML